MNMVPIQFSLIQSKSALKGWCDPFSDNLLVVNGVSFIFLELRYLYLLRYSILIYERNDKTYLRISSIPSCMGG